MEYLFFYIITLLGAIQGFLICILLMARRKENKRAFRNFLLFLFSLSFFNLIYALLYLNIDAIFGVPRASFPFPYKYLIGVGFFFYIRSQVSYGAKSLSKLHWLLFAPAIVYGFVRLYWYILLHSGADPDIFYRVYISGFFVYNEFAYLLFNLILLFFTFKFLKEKRHLIRSTNKIHKNWSWLVRFTSAFTAITLIHLIHQIILLLTDMQDSGKLYSIVLIINTVYIYWVGFEALTKSRYLFNNFEEVDSHNRSQQSLPVRNKLEQLLLKEEVYTQQNLKLKDLADLVQISEKELSVFIQDVYRTSFSEYINHLRVEKVKTLLHDPDYQKYTLLALAEIAGFSSKSSFNAVFKKATGMTPTQYKAEISA